MKLPFLFLTLLQLSIGAQAQDSFQSEESNVLIWVRASELDTRPADVVITADEIKKKSQSSLADVLSGIGGTYAPAMSSRGQFQSYFVQGGKSEHVLVLLDGVPVNDASSPSGGFDYSLIDVSQLERIEIFKGSHAVRYGSQAFAGVLLLVSKKPNTLFGARSSLGGTTEQSSRGQLTGWLPVSSESRVLFSVAHDQGYGDYAAAKSDGNSEPDNYRKWSSLLSIVKEDFNTSWRLSHFNTQNKNDYDNTPGPGGDDPNARSSSQTHVTSGSYEKIISDNKAFQFRLYNQNFSRYENDEADAVHVSFLQSHYQSNNTGAEAIYDISFGEAGKSSQRLLSGIHFSHENLDTDSNGSFSTEVRRDHKSIGSLFVMPSLYFQNQFSLHPGYRYECRRSRCWQQKDLDLRWSSLSLRGAESYRAPSFYQLYSAYGEPELKEEKVQHISLGFQKIFDTQAGSFLLSSSLYQNQYHQLIDFDGPTLKFINRGRVNTEGFDIGIENRREFFSRNLRQNVSFSYLKAKDRDTGLSLLRRPRAQISVQGMLDFTDKFQAGPQVQYRSKTEDVDGLGARVSVKDSTRVNLSGRYLFSSRTELQFQLLNIANNQTSDFWGYDPAQPQASLDLILSL